MDLSSGGGEMLRIMGYELKMLWRNNAVRTVLFGYIAAFIMTVWVGRDYLERELASQRWIEKQHQAEVQKWEKKENIDPGYLAYYLFMPTFQDPSPWSALFSGNRKAEYNNLRVRLLALHGQVYASDIQNTENNLLGSLDLGFLLIYILPLIIGFLSVNILADEIQTGRWSILSSQALSESHLLLSKLFVRFILVSLINIALWCVVTLWADIPWDKHWAFALALLQIYQGLWFALIGLIISWRGRPISNSLAFVCVWSLAAIIIPGALHLHTFSSYRSTDGLEVMIQQRQAMNDSWDKDRDTEFRRFLEAHPEWSATQPLGPSFHWKWYYSMQQLSDIVVQDAAKRYEGSRIEVARLTRSLAWLSPALVLELAWSQISQTDLESQMAYFRQLVNFHEALRNFYYPKFFFDAPMQPEHVKELPRFVYSSPESPLPWWAVWVLLAGILVFLMAIPLKSVVRFQKKPDGL